MKARRVAALPLAIAFGLIASASEASPVPARAGAEEKPTASPPARKPVRKQIKLSPQARERLTKPAVKRAPVKYVPLSKKEVRARVPADQRPQRYVNGKPKRATNAEVTAELNKIEKQLNAHGYSLRDTNKTVVLHEHQPDRKLLDQQVRVIRRVAETKPPRKPLSNTELRARVRSQARPIRKTPARAAGTANQYSPTPGPGITASADYNWSPSIGDSSTASAYLSTNASFSGNIGGIDPGMRGNVSITAGVQVLSQPYEAFRLDADLSSPLDGPVEAELNVTLMGGYQQPLVDATDEQDLTFERTHTLYDGGLILGTTIPIVGYPVSIDVIVTPTLSVSYGAELRAGMLMGSVRPDVKVEAKLEAYLDAWLVAAGAGGSTTLIHARPVLAGAAYPTEKDGQPSINAEIYGWVSTRFLDGRIYAFVKVLGFRYDWELLDYKGWEWNSPVYRYETAK